MSIVATRWAAGGRKDRTRALLVALAAVTLLVAVPSGRARGAGTGAVLEDCTETFVLVEGDDEAIRAAVPPEYTLGSEVPTRDLWSITSSCAAIRVGSGPARAGTVTFLGASVEAPEPGRNNPIHSYLFWAVTSNRSLSRALAEAGFPAYLASGTEQTFTPGVVSTHAQLSVPWPASPYRIASAQTELITHPHAHDAYWWHDGPLGPRRIVVHHSEFAEHVADCGLATQEGTRLAKFLGASERSTPCFLQGPTDSVIEF